MTRLPSCSSPTTPRPMTWRRALSYWAIGGERHAVPSRTPPSSGFATFSHEGEKAIEPRVRSHALSPPWERVPEGRVRGVLSSSVRLHALVDAAFGGVLGLAGFRAAFGDAHHGGPQHPLADREAGLDDLHNRALRARGVWYLEHRLMLVRVELFALGLDGLD